MTATATRVSVAVTVSLAVVLSLAASGPADPKDEARRLVIQNEILQKQIELASQEAFCLVLDPSAQTMTLMLKGAVLRTYRISDLEIGDPRVAFVSRGETIGWQGKIWSRGALVPPRDQDRIEIIPPPPGAADDENAAAPPVPPTPEERYPVPPRYGIRFEDGLFVEVSPTGESTSGGLWARIGAWWDDLWEVTRVEPTDRLRLRLHLRREDSEALYRSLPPDTKLLALPPR